MHPITTLKDLKANFKYAKILTNLLLNIKNNYIVIYPNNDQGSNYILKLYKKLKNKKNIKIFSSIRFEFFLSLLQNAKFILVTQVLEYERRLIMECQQLIWDLDKIKDLNLKVFTI